MYSSEPLTSNFTSLSKNILSDNKNKDKKQTNNIDEKPSASPDAKPIGPSASGSLENLFYINTKK